MDAQTHKNLRRNIGELPADRGVEIPMLVTLPDDLCNLFSWMLKKQTFTQEELSQYLALKEAKAREILLPLEEKGIIIQVKEASKETYSLKIKPKKKTENKHLPKDFWEKLD